MRAFPTPLAHSTEASMPAPAINVGRPIKRVEDPQALSVAHLDIPLTAPKIWAAIQRAPKR
jgi:hypothetical protein